MLVHRKVLPSSALNLLVPIYNTEWREALSDFQKCVAQGDNTMSPHRTECLLFSGHLLAVLRSVILPSIIQINARSRVSLLKINARLRD